MDLGTLENKLMDRISAENVRIRRELDLDYPQMNIIKSHLDTIVDLFQVYVKEKTHEEQNNNSNNSTTTLA